MPTLDLRPGDLVEVLTEEAILRTLDARGTLDSLPFMPEMLEFCGRQFRVHKRADKVCDTIDWGTMRRMHGAVHLEGVRCSGASHGGCQAGCLMYWKEAWLKRVPEVSEAGAYVLSDGAAARSGGECTRRTLEEATRRETESGELFTCQATELARATTSTIPWWEPGQYVRDIQSGNASIRQVAHGLLVGFFNKFQKANARLLPRFPLIGGARKYPFVVGTESPTTFPPLNLQPGDLVEVRSKEEIFQTLDLEDSTRGLRYDSEMLRYGGRRGRVLRRVEKIIDEKTGKMLTIKADCIIIDGFVCTGDLHRSCPRAIYPYWRESWLKRVEVIPGAERVETP